jgi:hypothetical protein
MPDASTQREQVSLQQLGAVSQARQIRLGTERRALAERERLLAQAMASQNLDESLLAEQRALCANRWQVWARSGGALREAVSLRDDQALLKDMAALLARRRAVLDAQSEHLAEDLRAWVRRWQAVQALEESTADRGRALQVSLERAVERQRDEDAVMSHARPVRAAGMAAVRW